MCAIDQSEIKKAVIQAEETLPKLSDDRKEPELLSATRSINFRLNAISRTKQAAKLYNDENIAKSCLKIDI